MAFQIKVDPGVFKQIQKFPIKDILKIQSVIKNLASDPYAGDIKKLGSGNVWRRRVGAYRIFFEISKEFVHIFNAERRRSKTY